MKTRFLYPLGVGFAVVILLLYPKWTVDDAYITYRYAENFAQHGQFAWNVNEPPVEGYTGIALPLLLAGAMRLGISPDVASKCLGVAALFASLFAFVLCLKQLRVREPVRAVGFLLLVSCPLMYTHALSGLETLSYAAAITFCFWAFLGCLDERTETHKQMETTLFLLMLISGLIRPEGVALCVSYMSVLLIARWRRGKDIFTAFVVRFVMIYMLPGLIYFIWRCWYYQQLLPNTFYAKYYPHGINFTSIRSLGLFLYIYFTLPLIAALGLYLFRVLQASSYFGSQRAEENVKYDSEFPEKSTRRAAFIANLLFLGLVTIQYARSSLLMNYGFRFYMPYMPILLTGITVFANTHLDALVRAKSARPSHFKIALGCLGLISLLQAANYSYQMDEEWVHSKQYLESLNIEHRQIAVYLRDNLPANEWIAVYVDGGVIPYVSGLKTVDFGKLNDSKLARQRLSGSALANYFFDRNVGAAVITSRSWNCPELDDNLKAIVSDPRFVENYVLFSRYKTDQSHLQSTYYQFLYLRKDLATTQAAGQSLKPLPQG